MVLQISRRIRVPLQCADKKAAQGILLIQHRQHFIKELRQYDKIDPDIVFFCRQDLMG